MQRIINEQDRKTEFSKNTGKQRKYTTSTRGSSLQIIIVGSQFLLFHPMGQYNKKYIFYIYYWLLRKTKNCEFIEKMTERMRIINDKKSLEGEYNKRQNKVEKSSTELSSVGRALDCSGCIAAI